MKYLLATLILCIFSITQSYAVNTSGQEPCDQLELTDGRIIDVQLLRQTETRVFLVLCGDKTMQERTILKEYVESIIVGGKAIEKPASHIRATKKVPVPIKKADKDAAVLIGGSIIAIVLYKYRSRIRESLVKRLPRPNFW